MVLLTLFDVEFLEFSDSDGADGKGDGADGKDDCDGANGEELRFLPNRGLVVHVGSPPFCASLICSIFLIQFICGSNIFVNITCSSSLNICSPLLFFTSFAQLTPFVLIMVEITLTIPSTDKKI